MTKVTAQTVGDVNGGGREAVLDEPQTFGDAAPALRPLVGSPTLVVSIMAGTTIAMLDTACGGNIVRAMPNTPAAIGRGMTVPVMSL